MVHINSEIMLSHKKNEILPFATAWMDLEGIMLSEMSQSEKDKYHNFTYVWYLKNKNEQNETRHTGTENTLMVARGERCWETGLKR